MTQDNLDALYVAHYTGGGSLHLGAAALYIGKGIILGVDIGLNRYEGKYTLEDGTLKASINMTAVADSPLVTGLTLKRGDTISISADLPEDFEEGVFYNVSVGDRPVQVVFDKIGKIPQ